MCTCLIKSTHHSSGFRAVQQQFLLSFRHSRSVRQSHFHCTPTCTMFKRRDWVHMHGQDGEGSSDEDSSEASEHNDGSGSSAGTEDSSAGSESSQGKDSEVQQQEAELGAKRLQDLSEDDFEPEFEDVQKPNIDVEELVQNWLTASDAELLKGPPLRCRWCPGTLLLNANSLKTHVSSKRHQKRQKLSEETPQPICLAEDFDEDDAEEAETHAERLQRLRKIAAPADLSGLSASQKRKVMRKLKAEQRRKAVLHRPGKRQRAELKAEVFKTAADDSAEKSAPSKKSRKSQDTRGKQNQDTRGKKKAGISKKKASISKMSRKSKV